jgi:hypothetical protein
VPETTIAPAGETSCPAVSATAWHDPVMVDLVRAMPGGIRLFLVYALVVLALIGLSLRFVVDEAIGAPVSGPGVVVMVLLAYTIFTTTLVLQRKQASRGLALGLASLTLPLLAYLLLAGLVPHTIFMAALAALLFRGLLRPEVRSYLSEE